ncbi:ABC-type glycerol-3-phosphate transport system substrate-binding protein [Labrenzia sp. EL_208]|uniref:ABC transporter substrate-binding protein n=1 Tax=Roseibium album TaxID=311410 RepID=UPI000CF168EF|nr:extracellular solute-binding protein [Roseibium album]MBG6142658.1 ABC-type glycerol-3-phosphate transport system substrate-binding protein [Labrenzia sp. EL_142]MBG6159305.1 ABC-type glycerol-3-phosphate transport system substrate-binding protein [Labrenzia sp. EL_162]MBG6165471.1 ABC-type glycerol-3-phosphate transport system substrate-binding protein [Labrenzia sp. EL_195]MBG6177669.1 ABC-type glycerol-3-phosphate transport system substrate-binding protein [Labrenzia sp. EL_132]MBG619760
MGKFRIFGAVAALSLTVGMAHADCGISSGNISVLANDFPALHAVVSTAESCAGDGITFNKNHTAKHNEISVAALSADPAEYTSKIVANSSIVPLLNKDLIRPLDDLVAKHGQSLKPNQLIRIDGKVMAVAFMANAQHLFVRQDILDQIGMPAPTTWEEVLSTAKAIREAGIMEYPFAALFKSDWNLGEEFVNMYVGHGGKFFEPGTAKPAINNETGIATLNMLKALTEYTNPDFLTYNTSTVAPLWESGEIAIAQLWGSTGGQLLDDEGSTPEVVAATVPLAAPTVAGGNTPASTLWWDGFTIAKNISDEDAEATFIAMVHGISDDMVRANNDSAVWLMDAYVPGKAAEGVAATAAAGAEPYPMLPFMGLMHQALFQELPDFLQGNETAEQALADIEAAYVTAATEQGFLK